MLKERTKFYNKLDEEKYMGDMFHEFLSMYSNSDLQKQDVNKNNVILIRQINEYFEKYYYFQRVTKVILVFLDKFDIIEDTFSAKLIKIKCSCKSQKSMIAICKNILKQIPIEKKYVEPIHYTVVKIDKRLDYLLKYVIPTYIELTPLKNYVEKIGEEAFFEEITKEIPLNEINIDNENKLIEEYIQKVLSSYSNNGNWEIGMKQYREFLKSKYDAMEKLKKEQIIEKKKKLAEIVEKKLISASNNFQILYRDGGITYGYNYKVYQLGLRVSDLHKKGRQTNKIVFLAKTTRGDDAAVHYFSADTEDNMTNSIKKATILEEFEDLPMNIQEKINNYDLVAVEMLV